MILEQRAQEFAVDLLSNPSFFKGLVEFYEMGEVQKGILIIELRKAYLAGAKSVLVKEEVEE